MSHFFVFPVDGLFTPADRCLVCYSSFAPTIDSLLEAIQRFCENNSPPERVVVTCPEYARAEALQSVKAERFLNRLPATSRFVDDPPVDVLSFGSDGYQTRPEEDKIIRTGMIHLFRKHDGLIDGAPVVHYVKPSRKHCESFLRTANALVHGTEIDFIAACCLRYCPKDLRHLYTDTGAIHSVAYAMLRLYSFFEDQRARSSISSFGSYAGLKDFEFHAPENSLVLISATTSGGLARDVLKSEPQFTLDQIVTLYFLGEATSNRNVVCNLTFHPKANPDGYDPIVSYSGEQCPLCLYSVAVPIIDEHFIPQGVKVEALVIAAKDAPTGMSDYFERIVGLGVLKANYRERDSSTASGDIYLDLEALFKDSMLLGSQFYRDRFDWIVSHCLSANTTRFIHLNDHASLAFAERLQTTAEEMGIKAELLAAKEIQSDLARHMQEGGTTLVVASAVSTGRALSEVAKHLRHIQKGGAIKYIVGFSKFSSAEDVRAMRSHLTWGDSGAGEHAFYSMSDFYFPIWRPGKKTSWEDEFDLLSEELTTLPVPIEARMEQLRESESFENRGLRDHLFLPKLDLTELELRPRFAFWKFAYGGEEKRVSQADVYATIVAVLHKLRNVPPKSARSLRQTEHVRRIISPRCFERYNDGIIQAAIVRAAFPIELDYSVSERESEVMRSILHTMFEHANDTIGEASLEMLLALSLMKIRLTQAHLDSLYQDFSHADHDNPWWNFLWEKIRDRFSLIYDTCTD